MQLPCQRCGQTSAGCWVCERCTMINCKAQAEIPFTTKGDGGKRQLEVSCFLVYRGREGFSHGLVGFRFLCCVFFLKIANLPTIYIYQYVYIYIHIFIKKVYQQYTYIDICIDTVEVKDMSKAIEIAFPSIC